MNADEKTVELLKNLSQRYSLAKLGEILENENSLLFKTDIFICLRDTLKASEGEDETLELLKEAKNIYNSPVYAVNAQKGIFNIKSAPDFGKALEDMEKYSFCFKLSPYHIINTFLAIVESCATGINLDELYSKAKKHIEDSIKFSLAKNPNWNSEKLTVKKPLLIMPIGGAGSGKTTLYKELSNTINFSCDNVRYLLFKNFGPCFSPWESALSWWTVNRLADEYLGKGYNIFYNGVNTDMEYRSPITMENPDPLFAGMPYTVKLVYFEPPVKLSGQELKELKGINLWTQKLEELDSSSLSPNVAKIIELIRNNYNRTLSRTKDISEGKAVQDPFDILYAVPAAIVKLFIEQSFEVPKRNNVIFIPRKEIPDLKERAAFYRKIGRKIGTELINFLIIPKFR